MGVDRPAEGWCEVSIGEALEAAKRGMLAEAVRCADPDAHRMAASQGLVFRCDVCGELVCGMCEGSDDTAPDTCDRCWHEAQS